MWTLSTPFRILMQVTYSYRLPTFLIYIIAKYKNMSIAKNTAQNKDFINAKARLFKLEVYSQTGFF